MSRYTGWHGVFPGALFPDCGGACYVSGHCAWSFVMLDTPHYVFILALYNPDNPLCYAYCAILHYTYSVPLPLFQTMALMPVFILLSFIVTDISGMSGTQFVPRGSMYASYSSWIVTVTIDVTPYRDHLTAVKSKFNLLKTNIHSLLSADRRNSSGGESPAIGLIRRYDVGGIQIEINHFEAEIRHLQHMLEVLNTFTTRKDGRKKRSLLPFVGDVLSTLFGSATQKDLDQLRDGLIALDNSQSQLAHVLAHSMTMINKTNSEVQRNRAVINQLSRGLSRLDSRVTALISDLKTNVHPFISYQQISQRVRGTLRVMARSLRMGYQALTAIKNNLQHVMQGSLPISLLPPSELIPLLQAISRAAPKGLTLPVDVARNPHWYYRRLATTLIADSDRLSVVIALPLIHTDSLYTLYEAVWVPTPHASSGALASYELEGPYIAISDKGDLYITLSQTDVSRCKTEVGYCSFSYPAASLSRLPTCLSSLFTQNERNVAKYCQTKISKDFGLPHAKHLLQDKWLISSSQELTFHVNCITGPTRGTFSTLKVSKRVQTLELGLGCTAYNEHIILPSYFIRETTKVLSELFQTNVLEMDTLPDIWNFTNVPERVVVFGPDIASEIPNILPNISNIPMLDPINPPRLHHFNTPQGPPYTLYVLAVVDVILIIGGLVGSLYVAITRKRSRTRYRLGNSAVLYKPGTDGGDGGVSLPLAVNRDAADDLPSDDEVADGSFDPHRVTVLSPDAGARTILRVNDRPGWLSHA